MKKPVLTLLVFLTWFSLSATAWTAPAGQKVDMLTIKGVINPIMASYVERGIKTAEQDDAICVLKIDTPGGLDSSMRIIIQRIMSSSVPVIAYVGPEGARCASAGVYIAYACHYIAMNRGTNLGAAHPVQIGMKEDKDKANVTMEAKITNDAMAYIKSLAQKRHRNLKWAEDAVRKSISTTAEEALKLKVIDFIAKDDRDLLKQLNNREVELPHKKIILHPELSATEIPMSAVERFIFIISDPNIALLLISIGSLGLIYEIASPGVVLPGIVGVIFLILGFYSLGNLPINFAGLFLIIFSFVLFIADIFAAAHGILTLGAIISFILGATMLIPAGYPYLAISKSLIFAIALTLGAIFGFLITLVVRSLRKRAVTGTEELAGAVGEARTELNPKGQVFVLGALWQAVAPPGSVIKPGEGIRVIKSEGLTLKVEKYEHN